jgi:hypothetical protein
MLPKDLTIYAVGMPHLPIRYESAATLVPVCAHASSISDHDRKRLGDEGWLFDDTGTNISSLNPWWGELTAIYWLLNNVDSPLIGNAQYRRYWDEEAIAASDENVLYVTETCTFGCSLATQFRGGHSFRGIEMTMEAAERGTLPFSASEMISIWQQPHFYGGPMIRGPLKHYKAFMNLFFDCLWPIWEQNEEEIKTLTGYDQRAMAFMGERLMAGIILLRAKFLPDIPMLCAPLHFIP